MIGKMASRSRAFWRLNSLVSAIARCRAPAFAISPAIGMPDAQKIRNIERVVILRPRRVATRLDRGRRRPGHWRHR